MLQSFVCLAAPLLSLGDRHVRRVSVCVCSVSSADGSLGHDARKNSTCRALINRRDVAHFVLIVLGVVHHPRQAVSVDFKGSTTATASSIWLARHPALSRFSLLTACLVPREQWPDDSRCQRHWNSTSNWTEYEKCSIVGKKPIRPTAEPPYDKLVEVMSRVPCANSARTSPTGSEFTFGKTQRVTWE